jgi:YfiH family protein
MSLVRFYGDPPTHLTCPALEELGLPHASTTRHCPRVTRASEPVAPFEGAGPEILRVTGLDLSKMVYLNQVHGDAVHRVDGGARGFAGEGDILLTATPGLPLSIFTADCLAVILVEPRRPLLTLTHVGWRGMVRGAVQQAVSAMRAAGAAPDGIWAAVSPSIGPCCYEVDQPVIEPLARAFPNSWRRWVTPRGAGKWMLDLWQANHDQLVASGVRTEQILNARLCTSCNLELYFSYRREGSTGRLVTIAALPT